MMTSEDFIAPFGDIPNPTHPVRDKTLREAERLLIVKGLETSRGVKIQRKSTQGWIDSILRKEKPIDAMKAIWKVALFRYSKKF